VNELALFAGVGSGLLGTQALGINTVAAVELDERCRCLLIQRQNERHLRSAFAIWDDIRSFDGRPWRGRVDILTGGFPCQTFSTAARGRNNADDLWPEMLRVAKECLPTYVFAENVSKRAIERAAEDCIALGYKADAIALSAKDLGADHVRQRYWLLAYADDKSQLRSTVNAEVAECEGVRGGIWEAEPFQPGMDDGDAERVDRYRATGNAQVPVVAAAALLLLANA